MKHYYFKRTPEEGERGVPPSSLIPIAEWRKRAEEVVGRLAKIASADAYVAETNLSTMTARFDARRRVVAIGFGNRCQQYDLMLEEAENYEKSVVQGCLQVPNHKNTSSKYRLKDDPFSAYENKAIIDNAKMSVATARSVIERKERALVYANLMLPEDAVVAKFGDQEPETTASKDVDALRRETADFVREVRKILQNSAYPRDSILAMIAKAIEEGSEKSLLANVKRLAGM